MKKSEESKAWEEEVLILLPLLVRLPATVMEGEAVAVPMAGDACDEANLKSWKGEPQGHSQWAKGWE